MASKFLSCHNSEVHATGANRILAFPHLSLFDMRYVLASMQMH